MGGCTVAIVHNSERYVEVLELREVEVLQLRKVEEVHRGALCLCCTVVQGSLGKIVHRRQMFNYSIFKLGFKYAFCKSFGNILLLLLPG